MTVRRNDAGQIVLEGVCPVEEAETLLQLLQATPAATVDWTACTRLHTAVIQVLLATGPRLVGRCGDDFVDQWIAPHIGSGRDGGAHGRGGHVLG